jgi:hypothetical protein
MPNVTVAEADGRAHGVTTLFTIPLPQRYSPSLSKTKRMISMRAFTLEQSQFAYRIDFVLYGIATLALTGLILGAGPRDQWLTNAAYALVALSGWTLVEYVVHRFLLHGVEPFKTWHAAHHQRPTALIFAPTLISGVLIATLLFLPFFFCSWGCGARAP